MQGYLMVVSSLKFYLEISLEGNPFVVVFIIKPSSERETNELFRVLFDCKFFQL